MPYDDNAVINVRSRIGAALVAKTMTYEQVQALLQSADAVIESQHHEVLDLRKSGVNLERDKMCITLTSILLGILAIVVLVKSIVC